MFQIKNCKIFNDVNCKKIIKKNIKILLVAHIHVFVIFSITTNVNVKLLFDNYLLAVNDNMIYHLNHGYGNQRDIVYGRA